MRDNLMAAQARNEALQRELEEAKEKLAAAEATLAARVAAEPNTAASETVSETDEALAEARRIMARLATAPAPPAVRSPQGEHDTAFYRACAEARAVERQAAERAQRRADLFLYVGIPSALAGVVVLAITVALAARSEHPFVVLGVGGFVVIAFTIAAAWLYRRLRGVGATDVHSSNDRDGWPGLDFDWDD